MKGSPLWREWESGESVPLWILRFLVLAGGALFLCFTGVMALGWPQQALLALLMLAVALWLDRSSSSYLVTLTLMLLSMYSTFRYGFWRVATTVDFFRSSGAHTPDAHWSRLGAFFMSTLLFAECYAFLVLFLGYMQMVWPLRRTPVPLPDDTAEWPAVDVLIPTLNEPLDVVRFTALAALNMDWPAQKLNVYILDDGQREEFREFAEEAGVGYMTRDDNRFAKAGNLNAALERLDSPFVVVFDSDHVPTRSFLQMTMGWFLRDAKLGILQTPHHFYSPDPFERNLGQFREIPSEDELFYGVVQDGNDFWNATYFCGSCAVLRRSALDEVGGLATETVTEDAHTSMRMQKRGWNSAYINIPQAAGLATERLSAHVRQRVRWARGMVQILRVENPLFTPGLTLAQRLCYFSAMSHFLYALPRLIFLTAPLMYLVFGYANIPGYWAAILAYAVPHLVLSAVTNSRIQGAHRYSFWNDIYETVLAPYLLLPTLLAMIHPRFGKFHVTEKGGVLAEDFFDSRMAWPTLLLLAFNWFGLCCAAPRLLQFPVWDVPRWASFVNWPATLYDPGHHGTVWINAAWTLFNMVLLGVAVAVASESRQRRKAVRVATSVPSEVVLADGSIIRGTTADLSGNGVRTTLEFDVKAAPGDRVQFVFPVLDGTAALPATVVGMNGPELRARFDSLNLEQQEALTMILYSRADRWLGWGESREPDRPAQSFLRILRLSMRGLRHAFFGPVDTDFEPPSRNWTANALPLLALGLLAGLGERSAGGRQLESEPEAAPVVVSAPAVPAAVTKRVAVPAAGGFHNAFSLADAGVPETIALRGVSSRRAIHFSVPQNELIQKASLKLRYHFSPALLPNVSQLKLSLNGTLFATVPVTAAPMQPQQGSEAPLSGAATLQTTRPGEQSAVLEATLPIPAELIARLNELTFEFVGHYGAECEDPMHTALWSHVDTDSTIDLAGTLIPLDNDLSLLPLPFYQAGLNSQPAVPIVFLKQPSAKAMQAAGIVASWFGILSNLHPVRFPVTIGAIPSGNAVVIAEDASGIPPALNIDNVSGPTLAMRTNPKDPYAKVLVLAGNNGSDLMKAAMALALERNLLQGPQINLTNLEMPAPRSQDDAPRWLSTGRGRAGDMADAVDTADLEGDGSQPAAMYVRLPPDLFYGQGPRELPLHLSYRYNGAPLGDDSVLQVWANGAFVGSVALPHTDRASTVHDAQVEVPVANLRPFSNTLMFRFVFQTARGSGCVTGAPPAFSGSILKDSYLEMGNVPHWTALPNLELFANAGYPFTRRADLAGTAVVLPDTPSPEELEIFLAMMGHFGAQTGYPTVNVSVTGATGMTANSGKDYLVLGTAEDQPAIRILDSALPVGITETGLEVRDTGGFFGRSDGAWWKVRSADGVGPAQLESAGGLPDALIEGLEWPRGSGHSMVAVVLRDGTAVPGFLTSFLRTSQSSEIAHSVSVLHGNQFSSYRVGSAAYMVGILPPMTRVQMVLGEFPWLIVVVAVIFCFLMASLLRAMLRRSARMRLQGNY